MKDSGLPKPFDTVSVLGAGAWGTALAQVAAAAGRKVLIWAREPDVVRSINDEAENALFLPGIKLNAAVRLETRTQSATPGLRGNAISWTAAAKPFGYLEGPTVPNRWGLVLPVFREVRLIPVDLSTAGAAGSHPGWAEHIYDHVPRYVERGLDALEPGCWYCAQLRTWENPEYRRIALDWIRQYSSRCRRSGPGTSSSGGSRRGH